MVSTTVFSIIICIRKPYKRFFKDLEYYTRLKYTNYEIIIVIEKQAHVKNTMIPVKVVRASKMDISLGEKRDIGILASKGKYCAFIDDDAYPDPNWLTEALRIFQSDSHIGAVGGPNVTPREDAFWEKIGGYIYESYLASGGAQYRFIPQKRRFVAELQGVNLIIRKDLLVRLGGFRSRLYSGDDSKVCSNIRSLGFSIIYDPRVLVYHHRRAFPFAHLVQIRNMGTHRGFFVKAFPDTLAPIYFIPSILTIFFIIGIILSFMFVIVRIGFISVLFFLYLSAVISVFKKAGLIKALIVALGIISTHIVYGIFFIRGLLLQSVERKIYENA
jgi:GT2 family glycosyltransferase